MTVTKETWIQAQCAVLGSCLIDESCSSEIVFGLRETDFVSEYRPLYRAIVELYTTGKPVDPVTVISVVGDAYRQTVKELMEITPTARNIAHYIRITAEQSRILHMRDVGLSLLSVDRLDEAQELLDGANGLVVTGSGMESFSLQKLLLDFFKRYESAPDYYDWFIPQLRRRIRLRKGNYMLLGARPSVGKSAFAMQAAVYWAVACGKRVGFYSDEMNEQDLTDRLVAMCAGIPLESIQERKLAENQINVVAAISSRISEAPLFVIPASSHPVSDIKAHALKNHLDMVIIDYLQIVPGRGDKEYDRVTRVSHEIQMMCKSTGITVLALSQLDRLKGAKPTLEDLRSSGQLEQDADIVAFLHRDGESGDNVSFILGKNRNGRTGTTLLSFNGSLQQFLYVGKGDMPIKPFDYSRFTLREDKTNIQNDDGQYDLLLESVPVPFETEQGGNDDESNRNSES